jgi:AcrR family transcriptional regulator
MKEHALAEIAAGPGLDGRAARSQRTSDAVIEALHDLIAEGDPRPNAQRIAARAGVSTRTVFAHFATLEDLYRATVERATTLVLTLLTPIDTDRPLADRIDALTAQRARLNEEVGPLRRAAALQEPFSPTLAEARRYARQASHEQVERIFAAELARIDPATRRRCVAAVDAVAGGETWDLLRDTHGLGADEARRTVGEAVRSVLPAAPGAGASGLARADDGEEAGQGGHAGEDALDAARDDRARREAAREAQARREAARRSLDEIERKVERLVDAIEAGSPADLLAPRLQALRAAKLSAERALADLGALPDDGITPPAAGRD